MYLVFASLILCSLASVQEMNHGIRVVTDDWRTGRLDPLTGKVSCTAQLDIPATNCTWDLGTGTKGQTSAIFYMNMTLFFLAQERCEENIRGRTMIFALMGPWCWDGGKPGYRFAPSAAPLVNVHADLMDLNIAWDHTCNIVVVSPNQGSVTTNQVSEYDGQQRIQMAYPQKINCDNCWRKVPGVGALDSNFHSSWPAGEELNCGDRCLFYTAEEQVINSVPVLPRAIIGRSYRTAEVLYNTTDSVQVQTLTWNPFSSRYHHQQFIGLGICCTASWCHPDCKDKPDQLVILSFSSEQGFSILETLGAIDKDSIRMGVEFSPAPFAKTYEIYVYYQKTVLTYNLKGQDGVATGLSKASQSPPVEWQNLHLWGNSGAQ